MSLVYRNDHRMRRIGTGDPCARLGRELRLEEAQPQGRQASAHAPGEKALHDRAEVEARRCAASSQQGAEDLAADTTTDRAGNGVSELTQTRVLRYRAGCIA